MRTLKIYKTDTAKAVNAAIEVLAAGGVVAYPTETFYGLGVRFDNEASLKRLYSLKDRPQEKTFPLIVGDEGSLSLVASRINKTYKMLMKKYWPGALTVLLPAKKALSGYITSNGKVAVRIPGESFALRLATAAGFPITATSANPAGMPPACNAGTVKRYFPFEIDLLIDGGKTPGGLPSTLVDIEDGKMKIIRAGAVDVKR